MQRGTSERWCSSEWSQEKEPTERIMKEDRLKTFIELTRQALEEDRFAQLDLSYGRKRDAGTTRPEATMRAEQRKKP